jgi:hypothetical protein
MYKSAYARIDRIGRKRRYKFKMNMSTDMLGFEKQKSVWALKISKLLNEEKICVHLRDKAQCVRKILLHVLRQTDVIFNIGDNDKFAYILYNCAGKWAITAYKLKLDIIDPLYCRLLISSIKKYRRLYRQYILTKYVTAVQHLRTCIPWDTVGVVLSFL